MLKRFFFLISFVLFFQFYWKCCNFQSCGNSGMVLDVCAPSGRLDCQLSVTFWPEIMYVTLHGVSGNKVNAHTRHVITRSHANGLTYLPWRYAHKNNRFGKGVRSHSSYLANTLKKESKFPHDSMPTFFFLLISFKATRNLKSVEGN